MKLYKTSLFEYFYKILITGLNTFALIVFFDAQGLLQQDIATNTNVQTVRVKLGIFVCLCLIIWCCLLDYYLKQKATIKVKREYLVEKDIPTLSQKWGAVCMTVSQVYKKTGDLWRKTRVGTLSDIPYEKVIGWVSLPLNTKTVKSELHSYIKYKDTIENFELQIPSGALYTDGEYYTFEVLPTEMYSVGTFICTEAYVATCLKNLSTQSLVYKLMDCVVYFAIPFLLGWIYLM